MAPTADKVTDPPLICVDPLIVSEMLIPGDVLMPRVAVVSVPRSSIQPILLLSVTTAPSAPSRVSMPVSSSRLIPTVSNCRLSDSISFIVTVSGTPPNPRLLILTAGSSVLILVVLDRPPGKILFNVGLLLPLLSLSPDSVISCSAPQLTVVSTSPVDSSALIFKTVDGSRETPVWLPSVDARLNALLHYRYYANFRPAERDLQSALAGIGIRMLFKTDRDYSVCQYVTFLDHFPNINVLNGMVAVVERETAPC